MNTLHYNEFIHEKHDLLQFHIMTTFLYIYNRSRRFSVHINDYCSPSLLRFTVIFRSSSRDRTAHEKKEIQQFGVENIQAQIHS